MFYILNFKTHEFISCNSANNVVVTIGNLLEQGAHQNDLEIINGLGEEVRFAVDEFSNYCKTLSLVEPADLDLFSLALEKEGDLRGYQPADADFPKYPHDFGNGYRIQTLYANLLPNVYVNDVGDIYDVKEDAEAEYPDAEVVIGFCVICDIPGSDPCPKHCKSFCKTVEEAVADYEKHILPELTINDSPVYDVEHQKSEPMRPSEFRISQEAIAVARKMLDLGCLEPYYQLRPQFMERISTDIRCFLDIDYEAATKRIPAPDVLDGKDYVTVFDPRDDVVAVISRDEVLHKEDFAALMKTAGMETTEENFNKVWTVFPDNIPLGSSLTDIALAAIQASMPEAELEFIFDDEIMVSDDMTKLEGYIWAMSSLVSRLEMQELKKFTLEEDQWIENINFYPAYDVLNGTVSLEGHYYLEDTHYARGKGFTLPLISEESARLIAAFESYCKQREGKSCLEFLNQTRAQEGLEGVLPRPLVNQIEEASARAASHWGYCLKERKLEHKR